MRTETKVLIAMRKKIGITQRGLSDMLGYTTSQYISNCERGMCGITPGALRIIRKEFGGNWAEKIIKAKVKDFEARLRGSVK